MKRSSSKDQTLKLYATTKKYGRRHDLQRDEQIRSASLVEYSKRNPDEEDIVMEAQVRQSKCSTARSNAMRVACNAAG